MQKQSFKLRNVVKIVAILAVLFVASCSKKGNDPTNPNNSVPDPAGTVTANITDNTEIEIGDYGYISWISPDNFHLYSYGGDAKKFICDLGQMNGLGNIASVPQTGFTALGNHSTTVACEKGHGYVVKFEGNGTYYVRLYVVEPILGAGGGVIGAKVKYQYPFN